MKRPRARREANGFRRVTRALGRRRTRYIPTRGPEQALAAELLIAAVEELQVRLVDVIEEHLKTAEPWYDPMPDETLDALANELGPYEFSIHQDGPERFCLCVDTWDRGLTDVAILCGFTGEHNECLSVDVFWSADMLTEPPLCRAVAPVGRGCRPLVLD